MHNIPKNCLNMPTMDIPILNPVLSALLFLQSLFLYLHYATTGFWSDDHWGIYFFPSFLGLVFLVGVLASRILFPTTKRTRDKIYTEEGATLTYGLFQMLTVVVLLFTLVLYQFYLDDETDLPFYWITTSFLVTTVLGSLTLIMYYDYTKNTSKNRTNDFAKSKLKGYLYVSLLVFLQGLFCWLYDSQWGNLLTTSYWVVAIPSFLLIAWMFYRVLMLTYRTRTHTNGGSQLFNWSLILILILFTVYVLIATVVHLSDPDVEWTQPKWIALPFTIFSGLLFLIAVKVFWETKQEERINCPQDLESGEYSNVSISRPGKSNNSLTTGDFQPVIGYSGLIINY